MGVAQRFYEAFTVRDHYTMGLLYAEHATFSDPVFQLLNAKGTRLMWQMLLSRAEDDFGIEYRHSRRRTFTCTCQLGCAVHVLRHRTAGEEPCDDRDAAGRRQDRAAGRHVQPVALVFASAWAQKARLLGWTPIVRNKIRAQASAALRDYARKVAPA